MRLDLYLKKSRIIKRRTRAKLLIDNNLVLLNNVIAKPSTNVKIGDYIVVNMYKKKNTYKILSLDNEPWFSIISSENNE